MADLFRLLRVKQSRTTIYHPQTDGLVERFNQTLKQMLRRVAADDRRDWDLMIPYVLFGIRKVPQASTGFTPFELLFGRQPRGLLDVAKEAWEQQPAPHRTVIEHVCQMRERIDRVMRLVREHLCKAQQAQQRHYNWADQPREFQPGDRVMVLVPSSACKFLASWQGPYTVLEKLGPVTYRVRQPGKRQTEQLYHINLLKKWVGTRDQLAALSLTEPVVVDVNPHLSAAQKTELQHLVSQFTDMFSSQPGQTNVVQHDIRTPPGVIVRQRPYRVPEARRQAIEEEVQQMLKLGVIEPSRSPWSSPIVIVPKPDGTLRFCNDFRRLNEVSEFDGYPMPRVDGLLDRLGRTRYIATQDLTKGYWQVPLSETAKPKTAFSTPSGHWQYRTLPFGLHGAPATFQRMMDIVVVHSEAWEEHLVRLRRVLSELRRAGLTANPRKCHLAFSEVKYLGFQTDASDTGLAAILFQIQEGEEHPVIYISRKLSPAERKYATVKKCDRYLRTHQRRPAESNQQAAIKRAHAEHETDSGLEPVDHGGESRITAGLKKYACFLTLDPNTANKQLSLSEENRKVTRVDKNQLYPDHPDRFDVCPQVLCKESVCGRCYWEIEWSGDVFISVSYKSISRKGDGVECWFGSNDQSWSLICSRSSYSFRHNNIETDLPVKPIISRVGVYGDDIYRVGVYVDESAGTLSFYSVSDTMSLILTVQTTFTQLLYPGMSQSHQHQSKRSVKMAQYGLFSNLVKALGDSKSKIFSLSLLAPHHTQDATSKIR
ncbi:Transposon Ty3-G Gag-Pol polyprotein [Labeo rohita]|uniref:ribonuclease H n=1 Tax=Labeo rohita TaxID=84645 RepID=A0ABQ8L2U1_LABRO|nr:Transposon Ty3-G Gag-Pol polyprotein [Labeo rohita]